MVRAELIALLTAELEALPRVQAAWLGGSDATGRVDALSDLDLVVVCDEPEPVIEALEAALTARSPATGRYRLPADPARGYEQLFLQTEALGPTLLLDLAVIPTDGPRTFLERERHGEAVFLLQRDPRWTVRSLDQVAHGQRIAARLADLRARFPLFQVFVRKALDRGQPVDAMQFYRGLTLIPLVELLRIRHCPDRFDFGLRYLEHDLPAELAERVAWLSYAADLDALAERHAAAEVLFTEVLAEVDASG